MCCKHWDSSYSENLHQSLLPELSLRRKYLSLSYFYNLINGHFEFPDMPATLRQPTYSTRSSHASIYVQPFAHSNSFLFLRPYHYGTLCHPMSCFLPLSHLLYVIYVCIYISFNIVIQLVLCYCP